MLSRNVSVATLALATVCGCKGAGDSAADAGEQPINFTFDDGAEGWLLNTAPGYTNFANLGAVVPDGGSPATLEFVGSDGDPRPGALRLTAAFTAPGQYVAAEVGIGRDLSNKTLHARFRLVSGPAAGLFVRLYILSAGPPGSGSLAPELDAAALTAGAWVPMVWQLDPARVDAAWVNTLGIQIYVPTASADGGSADGGAFASRRDLAFEIDTVTD